MARAWFLAAPLALFVWVLVKFDLEQALNVGLLSFVGAAAVYLLMDRLAWRGATIAAALMALATPLVFGVAELAFEAVFIEPNNLSLASTEQAEQECPPEGCVMISFPVEPEAER